MQSLMGWLWPSFSAHKCKIQLSSACVRMRLRKTKKVEQLKAQEREIVELIGQGKEDFAKIKVEQLIRDIYLTEAFDILDLFSEVVQARLGILEVSTTVPKEIREAVYSLVWSFLRLPIPELKQFAIQMKLKFGEEMLKDALSNHSGFVNEKLFTKLSVTIPAPSLVARHLHRLCPDRYPAISDVDAMLMDDAVPDAPSSDDFAASSQDLFSDDGDVVGGLGDEEEQRVMAAAENAAKGGGNADDLRRQLDALSSPPTSSSSSPATQQQQETNVIHFPSPPPSTSTPSSTTTKAKEEDEYAALSARFEALKRGL
ncbi:Vacuolar protein sorting-associated protein ist1 [Balamuthia mandrillaris]